MLSIRSDHNGIIEGLKMVYLALMVALAGFTLLDALVTAVGIGIGCVELNPVVTMLGVELWAAFRILLLGYLLTAFFVGYRLCSKHFRKGLGMLKATLLMLNSYIGTVVFFGFLTIILKMPL